MRDAWLQERREWRPDSTLAAPFRLKLAGSRISGLSVLLCGDHCTMSATSRRHLRGLRQCCAQRLCGNLDEKVPFKSAWMRPLAPGEARINLSVAVAASLVILAFAGYEVANFVSSGSGSVVHETRVVTNTLDVGPSSLFNVTIVGRSGVDRIVWNYESSPACAAALPARMVKRAYLSSGLSPTKRAEFIEEYGAENVFPVPMEPGVAAAVVLPMCFVPPVLTKAGTSNSAEVLLNNPSELFLLTTEQAAVFGMDFCASAHQVFRNCSLLLDLSSPSAPLELTLSMDSVSDEVHGAAYRRPYVAGRTPSGGSDIIIRIAAAPTYFATRVYREQGDLTPGVVLGAIAGFAGTAWAWSGIMAGVVGRLVLGKGRRMAGDSGTVTKPWDPAGGVSGEGMDGAGVGSVAMAAPLVAQTPWWARGEA